MIAYRVILAVLAVAILVAALMAVFASGATSGTVNVTATLTRSVMRSLPPPGRQSDDADLSWRITNDKGRTVGRMFQVCRWVMPRQRLCIGQLQMPLGTVTFAGASPTSFSGEYAVTGGTGVYAADGTLRFTAIGQRKATLLVKIR